MKTTADRKKSLLIQYHTVCSVNGLKEQEKEALLAAYKVSSSKDLSEWQLQEIIDKLNNDSNMWRKRVFASVGAWLRVTNKSENPNIIKAIACRATGYENFNKIPINRLRDVYYEFVRKSDVSKDAKLIKADIIHSLEMQN